jgi:NADH-quinone oxidoreductase subunit J
MPDLTNVNLAELVPLTQVVFWVMTVFTIAGGIGVVSSRNLFHSAFALILSFFGVTGYYVLLSAGFLAVVQLLIYIGSIAILILFAIMFSRRMMTPQSQANRQWWLALPISLVLFLVLISIIGSVQWPISQIEPSGNTVEQLGIAFLGSYLIPFMVVSILLSVALVGAIILAREKTEAEAMN